MMKNLLLLIIFAKITFGFGQTRIYKGFIDNYPIELTTYTFTKDDIRAIYSYNKYDTPIIINGYEENDKIILNERNSEGKITGKFVFNKSSLTTNELNGKWINTDNQSTLKVRLKKSDEFDYYDDLIREDVELIQTASTKYHYFKILISKDSGESIYVSGLRIYEKNTDKLIQEIPLNCQFWGLENVSVNDYNFDGIEDFSVFEASYAGPNTTSLYFLYDPTKKYYFDSGFSGISLEFDKDSKTIFERNSCCAGTSVTTARYKVVNNEMILTENHCYKWDNEKEELIERDIKDCR